MRVGILFASTQFIVAKSEFSCNTKFVDGTVQERTRLLLEGVRFKTGAGVDCAV